MAETPSSADVNYTYSEVNINLNNMLIEKNNSIDTNSTCNINSIESATINSNDVEELY